MLAFRRSLRSVRGRVAIGSAVLLAVSLGLAVLGVRQVLLTRLQEDLERSLAQEIEELRALAVGLDPSTGEPFGEDAAALLDQFLVTNVPSRGEAFYTFVRGVPARTSFSAPVGVFADEAVLRRWTQVVVPTRVDASSSDGEFHSLAVPLLAADGTVLGTFVVASYPAAERADVNRVVRTVAVIASVVAVLGSVAAWSVAGHVLRPVRDLTNLTKAIDAGELAARVPVTGGDELAELGRTFNSMLDRLDDAFTSQRAFLDDVAHELRTPITIVRGHLEMLDEDPASRATTVALVTDELDRMSRYVSDLLLVAKAVQPDFLRPGLVDAADIVDSVLAKTLPLGERRWERGMTPRPGSLVLLADGDRLIQALLALVSNAVQHTGRGDRIEVSARRETEPGGRILFAVADTGPGLAAADRARVFERFSRATSAAGGAHPDGTGLGLAIVAAIVRAHGCDVGVESTPITGATFWFAIPDNVAEEEADAPHPDR